MYPKAGVTGACTLNPKPLPFVVEALRRIALGSFGFITSHAGCRLCFGPKPKP